MQESGKTSDRTQAVGCPAGMVSMSPRARVVRMLPIAVLLALLVLAYARGWFDLLTLENIAVAHERWHIMLQQHQWLAIFAYACAYVAVGAFCVPGGAFLTAAGGLAFGVALASLATVVGATLGALILFLSARTACSEWLTRAEGPWLRILREGFAKNALSYLLFLRLVPAFPFWFVNVAAAILCVPLKTFAVGTFFGIIPATVAFASAGAGLGSVIAAAKAKYQACLAAGLGTECRLAIPKSALFTKELMLALVLLGVLALIPVIVDRWRRTDVEAR